MARKILVAVDGSFHSRVALDFTAQNVLRHPRTSDELHLATVLPPLTHSMTPMGEPIGEVLFT